MYATRTAGYDAGANQLQSGILDYVVLNNIGYDIFEEPLPGIFDYVVLSRMGYNVDTLSGANPADYVGFFDGYQKDIVNIHTGIVDYLIDRIPYNILIEQDRGWEFNWELITKLWDTIDNNWEG